LREKLGPRAEVINAAIPGYTVYQERILLERYLIDYKPDVIIQQYCLNDNLRFLHRFTEKGGMIWTQEAQRALFPQQGDPLAWLPSSSYLAVRLRLTYTRWTKPSTGYPWEDAFDFVKGWQDDGWTFFREQFGLIRKAADSVDARLTVIMFPFAPQFRADLLAKDETYVLKPQRVMKEICDEAGVPLLDMYPVLRDAGGAELLPDRIHLSEEGHRITAGALYEHLLVNGLIRDGASAENVK
jgi:lysophospholipase L1-like esterase